MTGKEKRKIIRRVLRWTTILVGGGATAYIVGKKLCKYNAQCQVDVETKKIDFEIKQHLLRADECTGEERREHLKEAMILNNSNHDNWGNIDWTTKLIESSLELEGKTLQDLL